ncbi:hypothetical protein F2P81_009010 [Scophthalmus maximus]|uniref:Uncharacterized protein n=1 Tax=Scophthalmus maximus TaxID=52904 RepID=A0A6A4STH6_SCOMX|nr:hypothetical protein F2P81_009010 [Scophthalmus maximus]
MQRDTQTSKNATRLQHQRRCVATWLRAASMLPSIFRKHHNYGGSAQHNWSNRLVFTGHTEYTLQPDSCRYDSTTRQRKMFFVVSMKRDGGRLPLNSLPVGESESRRDEKTTGKLSPMK